MKSSIDWWAILFASTFPLAMAYLYFVVIAGAVDEANPWMTVAYGVGKLIQFPFPLVYIALFHRDWLRGCRPRWKGIGEGVGFGLLVAAAMFALYFGVLRDGPLLGDAGRNVFAVLRKNHLDTPTRFVVTGLLLSTAHSLLEEYYWRWFVFGLMKRHLPPWAAVILSGLAFMAHHVVIVSVYFPWNLAIPFSLGVAVGGGVWAWLYHRHGSLIGPWLSPLLVDAAIFVVGYDLVRGAFS